MKGWPTGMPMRIPAVPRPDYGRDCDKRAAGALLGTSLPFLNARIRRLRAGVDVRGSISP